MAKPEDIRLGQYLVRKRWCSLRQVNHAFDLQRRLREEGKSRPLTWVLARETDIDREKLKVAMAELGILRLSCSVCHREVPVTTYSPDSVHRCPTCNVDLTLIDATAPSPAESFRKAGRGGAANGGMNDKDDSPVSFVAPPAVPAALAAPPADAAAAGADEDPIVGKIIGGCQVLSRIARGGMGVVYRARQLKLGRVVAVKILSEELATDRKYVHRFLREAHSAAELSHGNIVHIIDVGELNGLFYILMEYVDGSSLREILDETRTIDPQRTLEIALQASHALNHAHKRGIIHRDIKPENIMLTRDGVVKIADLGLAKKIEPDHIDGGITQTKAIMGTPFYMAPEQIKDFRQVDGRTDIYSLGVTLFRALTGSVPFEGRTPVEVMIKVIEGKRPALRSLKPNVPEEVERLVDGMMQRAPADRPQSLVEVIKEIDRVLQCLRERAAGKKSVPSV